MNIKIYVDKQSILLKLFACAEEYTIKIRTTITEKYAHDVTIAEQCSYPVKNDVYMQEIRQKKNRLFNNSYTFICF